VPAAPRSEPRGRRSNQTREVGVAGEMIGQAGRGPEARVPGQRRLDPVRVDQERAVASQRRERERGPEGDGAHAFAEESARETHHAQARAVDAARECREGLGLRRAVAIGFAQCRVRFEARGRSPARRYRHASLPSPSPNALAAKADRRSR